MSNPIIKTYMITMEEVKEIVFTTSDAIPDNKHFIDLSKSNDMSIVGWYNEDETILYIAPKYGDKIIIDKSSANMFQDCENLEKITGLQMLDTSNVTNMNSMFSGCISLKELDLSSFNTDNVCSMEYMFSGCMKLEKIDLSNFNTQNVVSMEGMFDHCKKLKRLNLSHFNVESVINTAYMFFNCENLSNLKLSIKWIYIDNVAQMFRNCKKLSLKYEG